jgi:hypothetical protein
VDVPRRVGEFTWNGGTMRVQGVVTMDRVLWDFPTNGPSIDVFKPDMVAIGTFLAATRRDSGPGPPVRLDPRRRPHRRPLGGTTELPALAVARRSQRAARPGLSDVGAAWLAA